MKSEQNTRVSLKFQAGGMTTADEDFYNFVIIDLPTSKSSVKHGTSNFFEKQQVKIAFRMCLKKYVQKNTRTTLSKMRSQSKQGIVNIGTNVEEGCFPSRRATSARCFLPARCCRQQSSPDV